MDFRLRLWTSSAKIKVFKKSHNFIHAGQCLAYANCYMVGGYGDGSCAEGFGVCCLFFTTSCGSTITQNITYLQNPGYPSGYSTSASTDCFYYVNKVHPLGIYLQWSWNIIHLPAKAVKCCALACKVNEVKKAKVYLLHSSSKKKNKACLNVHINWHHLFQCDSSVCQIRIDFETLNLQNPHRSSTGTTNQAGKCVVDTLNLETSSGDKFGSICGMETSNSQHLYLGQ